MIQHETPPSDMTAEQAAKRADDAAHVAITYAGDVGNAFPGAYSDAAKRKADALSGAADALSCVAWWAAVAANLMDKADLARTYAKVQGDSGQLHRAESDVALAKHYAQAAKDSYFEAFDAIHDATLTEETDARI